MSKMFRTSVLAGVCLVACIGLVHAQANQGVCEGLQTATPGLYGLCIAFCEAHECEPDFTRLDPFADCTPADSTLLDRYDALRDLADPPMPCVAQGPCPCFTQEQVDDIPTPYFSCVIDFQFGPIPVPGQFTTNILSGPNNVPRIGAQATVEPDAGSCAYGDSFVVPEIFIFLETNLTQAQACRQILVDKINSDPGQCLQLCTGSTSDPICQ